MVPRTRSHSRPRAPGDTRTRGSTRGPTGSTPSERRMMRSAPTIRCWSRTSWSRSRSTDRTAPGGSSWAGRISWPARGLHRTAGSSRGSSGTTRRCRGTRCACRLPRSSAMARWARRGRWPAAPGSASSRPAGARPGCSTRPGTPPAGGTCTRSTAPTGSRVPPAASRRWRRRSAAHPGSWETRRTGSPTTAPSSRSRAAMAAPGWSGSRPTGSSPAPTRRGRSTAVCRSGAAGRWRQPPGRRRARSSSALTPGPARPPGCWHVR